MAGKGLGAEGPAFLQAVCISDIPLKAAFEEARKAGPLARVREPREAWDWSSRSAETGLIRMRLMSSEAVILEVRAGASVSRLSRRRQRVLPDCWWADWMER